MCTLLTIDKQTYSKMRKSVLKRIVADARFNSDGGSLVFLDPMQPNNNTVFRSMSLGLLTSTVKTLMQGASDHARLFVHMRAATTAMIGVGFTHAFDDMNGTIYMHNGVISNPNWTYAVDSFRLVTMGEPGEMFKQLLGEGETFANIFVIDTLGYKYSVLRLSTGSLFTDGQGNYATNECGRINQPVPRISLIPEVMRQVITATADHGRYGYGDYDPNAEYYDNEGKRWELTGGMWKRAEVIDLTAKANDRTEILRQTDEEYLRNVEESTSPYSQWDSLDDGVGDGEFSETDKLAYETWLRKRA